ncbi:YifB family Mg chelatase-like AAA ATPase [Sulfurisoma sediminicola]|uniref:Magnesium chelatase family protein n=1 Tax=Sulfurisoma sediminicola TaxID=1381557 RepID=A0A497XJN1_9PROT|nr:YifB family Mg chelatase-like AAA ATPase [Sulfurisoma sediminicola]RLJ68143.1 magnesium chelatase family protein [Sulfurisoma sediminicola]
MSLAVLRSRALAGMAAPEVTVEVHLAAGLPSFTLVGLPDTEVKEARDRVRAAIQNAHFEFPARRITVNLAPADLPKESGRFDLPIALGILIASGQIKAPELDRHEFAGELSLSGELRPVRGALAMCVAAAGGGRSFVLPRASAAEAALIDGIVALPAGSLLEVCAHLAGQAALAPLAVPPAPTFSGHPDLAEVKGQAQAKRALEVVAAGGHSLLMSGPPGSGKSMLAQRLPGILPPMTRDEALASAAVQSLAGLFDPARWGQRPFRAPHHTASAAALVGGGGMPRPGEISLAHHGVLFLDELPEFQRSVLEALREPLETGHIHVARAARRAEFPARFQLVAAMNPCPCGYLGEARCRCTPDQVARYRSKLSGPFLDRIDLMLEVPAVPEAELSARGAGETSAVVRSRVAAARERQIVRQDKSNALLSPDEIDRYCLPDCAGAQLLKQAMTHLRLSARAYHRVLKVARSVADLAGEEMIRGPHVAEAIQYRRGFA